MQSSPTECGVSYECPTSVFAMPRIGRHDRELSRSDTEGGGDKNPLEDMRFCMIHVTNTIPSKNDFRKLVSS